MARSNSGRSVARAAATGGGATYRGQMPINWYAALVVIVLVGLASVALAKYNYNRTAPAVEPTTNTTWHAALAFDICGTMEPALPASPAGGTTGLTSAGSGVLVVAPRSDSEAGANATLGKFASGYTGLTLTNTTVQYPKGVLYQNPQRCAKGTPDAGKVGELRARWWVLSTQSAKNGQPQLTGGLNTVQPADLKFVNRQVVTVFYGPDNATIPQPPSSTVKALQQTLAGNAPVATTTTVPGTTTTSQPASSTTTTKPAASTTTTKPAASSTTTTAKSSTTSTTK
jgi:cell division septation protein DedD